MTTAAGRLPRARPLVERLGHQVRVDLPGGGVAVDEHRSGADVADGVGGGHEGEGGHDDLVAGSDAGQQQRQVQRGGAARHGRGMADPGHVGHLALEGVDVRADGSDPAPVERGQQGLPLGGTHVGRGQVDAAHGAWTGTVVAGALGRRDR